MEKKAKVFVNSPNAIAGNYTAKCDTASADFQSTQTGNIDFVGTEEEIADGIRKLISLIHSGLVQRQDMRPLTARYWFESNARSQRPRRSTGQSFRLRIGRLGVRLPPRAPNGHVAQRLSARDR